MIDEMIQDTMEFQDEADLEEEAQGEVDKVLFELTDGLLGQAGAVGKELEVSLCILDQTNFTVITRQGIGRYQGASECAQILVIVLFDIYTCVSFVMIKKTIHLFINLRWKSDRSKSLMKRFLGLSSEPLA